MSTTTETAVHYERDADGIVTLTLDDPSSSANTMNELYISSMKAAVDRLYDEQDGRLTRTRRIELDVTGARTSIAELIGTSSRRCCSSTTTT